VIGKCFFRPRTLRSAWPAATRAISSRSISAWSSPPSTTTASGGGGAAGGGGVAAVAPFELGGASLRGGVVVASIVGV
jgi:hypothetical protein